MLLKKYSLFLELPDNDKEDRIVGNFKGHPITESMRTTLKIVDNFNLITEGEIKHDEEMSVEDREIYTFADVFVNSVKLFMKEDIHSFRMEQDLIGLLLKSDAKVRYIPSPFRTIFIDADININEKVGIHGLFIRDESDKKALAYGGMIKIKKKYGFVHLPYINEINDNGIIDYYSENVKKKLPKDFQDAIANFVCCFLYFVDYPDIEIIKYSYKEQTSKRNDKNKVKYRDNFIRLTGKTKIYLENLRKLCGGKIDWTYSFWVRGHFMHLKAKRYKEARGKSIWRKPFIKGKGTLIKKEYTIKSATQNNSPLASSFHSEDIINVSEKKFSGIDGGKISFQKHQHYAQ